MSATAISSTSSFAEYAARWDWAMLPAPMTPTRNFVMRVSFTWGSGEQVLGVGDPALAAQEAVLPALELDRGTAGEVGVADRAGHCTKVDVAVADHRPAQVLAAAAAEPAGTRVGIGRADVEVLEVDHHRVGQVLGDGDRGVLVDAHEVADIQRGAEVRLVDRMDDAPYPLRGLHEEAVVLEAGGDAAACPISLLAATTWGSTCSNSGVSSPSWPACGTTSWRIRVIPSRAARSTYSFTRATCAGSPAERSAPIARLVSGTPAAAACSRMRSTYAGSEAMFGIGESGSSPSTASSRCSPSLSEIQSMTCGRVISPVESFEWKLYELKPKAMSAVMVVSSWVGVR